jgi:hypothetical protein
MRKPLAYNFQLRLAWYGNPPGFTPGNLKSGTQLITLAGDYNMKK